VHYIFPLTVTSLPCHATPGTLETVIDILKNEYSTTKSKVNIANLGSGNTTDFFKALGFNVRSFDIDPPNKDVIFLDLNSYEDINTDLLFNCVIGQEVIEHLENPWLLMRKANRLLLQNGLFVMTTPNCHSLLSKLKFLMSSRFHWFEDKDIDYHINPIFLWEVENIAKKTGFELIGVKGNSEYYFNYPKSSKRPLWASESLVLNFRKVSEC
jgi:SAM-dependent methyltransferase